MKSVILAVAFALPLAAHAESFFQIEAGLGVTQYETQDGRWYQQGMPVSSVSARNLAWSVGATGALLQRGRWGIDWHVDYVNLGRAAAACECTPNDANYNPSTHAYNPNVAPAPLAYFTGNGRSQGFVLSVESYYWLQGVRLGVEVGAYVNYSQWQENVYGWTTDYATARRDLSISTCYWGVVPVVGASVGNETWLVGYRHYFTSRQHLHEEYPPVWNDVDVIELKYRF